MLCSFMLGTWVVIYPSTNHYANPLHIVWKPSHSSEQRINPAHWLSADVSTKQV